MPENLSGLSDAIANHLNAVQILGELLEICREELLNSSMDASENTSLRISVLLTSYVSQAAYHFNELNGLTKQLKTGLVRIRQSID